MELTLIRVTKVAGFSAILLVLCFVVGFSANATTTNGLNAQIYNVSGQVIPPTVLGNATPAGTYTVPQLLEDFDSNPRFGLGDTFVVKYTGYIVSETTQAISFYGPADDGFRLIIDTATVINDWYDKGGGGSVSDPISFTANVPKRIEAWYYENGGGANVELMWNKSGQMNTIPTGNLYLTDPLQTPLNQCVSNIDDPNFSKSTILSIIGMSEEQLLAAVDQGTITIVIAQGSGEFGNNNGAAQDIYCGNSQNNTVSNLDSNQGTRDYFFGGAGNDHVDHSWFSNFYGGAGDDTIDYLDERSFFYGGAGEDSCANVSQGIWGSTCNPENTVAPSLNPPTNLTVSAQSDGIHLSWVAPTPTNANTAVESYAVSWSTSNFTTNGWGISSSETYTVLDYSVINSTDGRGKEYQFNVRSDNNTLLVVSSNSESVTAYVPREAPTISLTPKNLSIDVAVSYTNPNTWFYQVLTSQEGCANPYAGQTLNTEGHPETFTVSNLDNNCLYQVKVANWDSATSLYSSQSATPLMVFPENSVHGTANEWSELTLTAPEGKVFSSIYFASYGLPNSYNINSQCHANIDSVITQAFIGKNTGTVQVTNVEVTGDPCSGTQKHMSVILIYEDAPPPPPTPTPSPSPQTPPTPQPPAPPPYEPPPVAPPPYEPPPVIIPDPPDIVLPNEPEVVPPDPEEPPAEEPLAEEPPLEEPPAEEPPAEEPLAEEPPLEEPPAEEPPAEEPPAEEPPAEEPPAEAPLTVEEMFDFVDDLIGDGKISSKDAEQILDSLMSDGEIDSKEVEALTESLMDGEKLTSAEEDLILDALNSDGEVSDSEVDNLSDTLSEDGKFTEEEKGLVAEALIQAADGQAVTAQNIQDAGLAFQDLPPETPVEVRTDVNGNEVVITADVAVSLELLADPAELLQEAFTDPGAALKALGSIGADMSSEERDESTDAVVATVIAAGAAINAVGAATAGAVGAAGGGAPSSPGGSGGTGGGPASGGGSGSSSGSRRRVV